VKVGEDEQGNIYYTTRDEKRRWVIFNGEAEASRVNADWHSSSCSKAPPLRQLTIKSTMPAHECNNGTLVAGMQCVLRRNTFMESGQLVVEEGFTLRRSFSDSLLSVKLGHWPVTVCTDIDSDDDTEDSHSSLGSTEAPSDTEENAWEEEDDFHEHVEDVMPRSEPR